MNRQLQLLGSVLLLYMTLVYSDQPVMNEVPRWDNGYGFQVFQEWRWSDDLKDGNNDLANPNDLSYQKNITHFEAVYTWSKWIRATVKIPFVDQKRKVLDSNGNVVTQHQTGFDDIKLALPLRKYFNKPRQSGHIGIVPQFRFGGETDSTYSISDGSFDPGFSFTAERETAHTKVSIDLTYWSEQEDHEKDEFSADLTLGWNFHDRGALNWETEYIKDTNQQWIGAGPTFFWNFNDIIMTRLEYKHAFYENTESIRITRGNSFRFGLGVIF